MAQKYFEFVRCKKVKTPFTVEKNPRSGALQVIIQKLTKENILKC